MKAGNFVAGSRENELTLVEAKSYMQRIIQLLREGARTPN